MRIAFVYQVNYIIVKTVNLELLEKFSEKRTSKMKRTLA